MQFLWQLLWLLCIFLLVLLSLKDKFQYPVIELWSLSSDYLSGYIKTQAFLISKKASFLSRTSRNVLYLYQQEKNKETNKKFQIFYLKRELTSFEEIQSGDFINNLASFLCRTSRNLLFLGCFTQKQ